MASDTSVDLKAGRRRVARTRGAASGIMLIILGLWSALIPFVGPYFNFGYIPSPDQAWKWTTARGVFEVLPGAVAVIAGVLLLVSASRALTLFAAWIAALAGAWLVISPTLAGAGTGTGGVLTPDLGMPDPTLGTVARTVADLLYFHATGAAMVLIGGVALGRLSVHSVRDVRVADRRARAEAEQQAAAERHAEAERHTAASRRQAATDGSTADGSTAERSTVPGSAGSEEPHEPAHAAHARPEHAAPAESDGDTATTNATTTSDTTADPAAHREASGSTTSAEPH